MSEERMETTAEFFERHRDLVVADIAELRGKGDERTEKCPKCGTIVKGIVFADDFERIGDGLILTTAWDCLRCGHYWTRDEPGPAQRRTSHDVP